MEWTFVIYVFVNFSEWVFSFHCILNGIHHDPAYHKRLQITALGQQTPFLPLLQTKACIHQGLCESDHLQSTGKTGWRFQSQIITFKNLLLRGEGSMCVCDLRQDLDLETLWAPQDIIIKTKPTCKLQNLYPCWNLNSSTLYFLSAQFWVCSSKPKFKMCLLAPPAKEVLVP